MPFERKDLETVMKKKAAEAKAGKTAGLEILKRAALAADMMTGDPAWDEFLSYVQHHLETATRERNNAMAQLMSPQLHDPNTLANVRMLIIRLGERIAVMTEIIALPKKIKEMGEGAARTLIEQEQQAEAA